MFTSLIAAALAAPVPDVRTAVDYERLRGAWVAEAAERDGGEDREEARFTFAGRKVTAGEDGAGGFAWQIRIDPTKDPREIDFTRPSKEWEKESDRQLGVKQPRDTVLLRGIYELEGDTLTICFCSETTLVDGTYQESVRPTDFTTRVGGRRVLYRLKRAAKKD